MQKKRNKKHFNPTFDHKSNPTFCQTKRKGNFVEQKSFEGERKKERFRYLWTIYLVGFLLLSFFQQILSKNWSKKDIRIQLSVARILPHRKQIFYRRQTYSYHELRKRFIDVKRLLKMGFCSKIKQMEMVPFPNIKCIHQTAELYKLKSTCIYNLIF